MWLYHVFFLFLFDSCFLIPALITQIFNTAELAIPKRIPTSKVVVETETQPVTVGTKISKCSV